MFKDPNNVAAEAIRLTHDYNSAYLDEIMNLNLFLIEENLQQIVNKCKELDNWQILQNVIYLIFSNRQNLSSSFLQKGFLINISSSTETSTTTTTSATPKSNKKNKFSFIFILLLLFKVIFSMIRV